MQKERKWRGWQNAWVTNVTYRAITWVFCHDLHLTLIFSGLLQICLFKGRWKFGGKIVQTKLLLLRLSHKVFSLLSSPVPLHKFTIKKTAILYHRHHHHHHYRIISSTVWKHSHLIIWGQAGMAVKQSDLTSWHPSECHIFHKVWKSCFKLDIAVKECGGYQQPLLPAFCIPSKELIILECNSW